MEKCFKVTLNITNDKGESADGENPHSLIIFAYGEELAWLKALTDISADFSSEKGWKHELISIEEKSAQELKEHIYEGKPL